MPIEDTKRPLIFLERQRQLFQKSYNLGRGGKGPANFDCWGGRYYHTDSINDAWCGWMLHVAYIAESQD